MVTNFSKSCFQPNYFRIYLLQQERRAVSRSSLIQPLSADLIKCLYFSRYFFLSFTGVGARMLPTSVICSTRVRRPCLHGHLTRQSKFESLLSNFSKKTHSPYPSSTFLGIIRTYFYQKRRKHHETFISIPPPMHLTPYHPRI